MGFSHIRLNVDKNDMREKAVESTSQIINDGEGTHKSNVSQTIDTKSEGTSSLTQGYDSNSVVHASEINVDIRDNRTHPKYCVSISSVN